MWLLRSGRAQWVLALGLFGAILLALVIAALLMDPYSASVP
ncbi:MAG TPA: hypothetical protein VGJ60_34745 [Chloroflexota bacterium]|jgi:hypothetical protein